MCREQIEAAKKEVRSLSRAHRAIERDMALERLIVKGIITPARIRNAGIVLTCTDVVDIMFAGL